MKYIGYHESDKLPIKKGDTVTIVKGTPLWNTKSHDGVAKRTYTVKVDHILSGRSAQNWGDGSWEHKENPKVRWPGRGGYWNEVDINLIPEANK